MSGTVTIFATCLADILQPELASTSRRLVEDTGRSASVARGASCCGQPGWNAGYTADARRVAARTLKALQATDGPIVVPAGSCATMIGHEWPRLFQGTRREAAAREIAGRVVELSAFLAEHGPLPADDRGGHRVGVHDSCHMLRELGVKREPRALLEAAGHEIVETTGGERCCGFGGTFSVKLPEVSIAMADEKLDEWTQSGVDEVVGCDLSCLTHLRGRAEKRGLALQFVHLADLLDQEADPV